MQLTTSKGKTYQVDFAGGPTVVSKAVLVQLSDERRLPVIAAEFDGLEWLEKPEDNTPAKRWEGYGTLTNISRADNWTVLIRLEK